MGLFGKKKQDLVGIGLTGTALIDSAEDKSWSDRDESFSLADLGVGNVKYQLWLDVTVDDGSRPTYRVVDKFKVPAKLESWMTPGVKVPVWIDPADPNHVQPNWDQFEVTGGDPEFHKTASANTQAAVRAAMGDDNRNLMLTGWITARKSNALSSEQFEEALAGAVTSGMITQAEADAARGQAG